MSSGRAPRDRNSRGKKRETTGQSQAEPAKDESSLSREASDTPASKRSRSDVSTEVSSALAPVNAVRPRVGHAAPAFETDAVVDVWLPVCYLQLNFARKHSKLFVLVIIEENILF